MMPSPCGPLPPAFPARPPHYVLPGSHLLDPAYRLWQNPNFPFPRFPLPFETQTRACGTGLFKAIRANRSAAIRVGSNSHFGFDFA